MQWEKTCRSGKNHHNSHETGKKCLLCNMQNNTTDKSRVLSAYHAARCPFHWQRRTRNWHQRNGKYCTKSVSAVTDREHVLINVGFREGISYLAQESASKVNSSKDSYIGAISVRWRANQLAKIDSAATTSGAQSGAQLFNLQRRH